MCNIMCRWKLQTDPRQIVPRQVFTSEDCLLISVPHFGTTQIGDIRIK